MENQIFKIYTSYYKSFIITNDAILLSKNRLKTLEKFEKELQSNGIIKTTYAYPLSKITAIKFNESSNSVKINYINDKNEDKKLDIEFGDKKLSNRFGHFLGQKMKMTKNQQQESKWKRLLISILWLVFTVGITYYLVTIEDTIELVTNSTGKVKLLALIIKLIIDTIGHTGVIIFGTFFSVIIIYRLYRRLKNPADEIEYIQKLF